MPRHPHILRRAAGKLFAALPVIFAAATFAGAQQRPLITEDVDVVKPGIIRVETGFEFLQDIKFPLSGLRGDMTKVLDTRVSVGLSPMVEFQIEWTPQNLLSIRGHGPTPLDLKLGANPRDTNDAGDVTVWMKMKLRNETRITPSLGFRFGVQLPNSNQARGIGSNTTNFYATINAGKKLAGGRLNVFGNLGVGILEAPLSNFTQNDVLLYGLASIYRLSDRVNLVGEVNGQHSTRKHAPLGTEDYSAARVGAQIRALGLRFNAAGVFGLSDRAPKTGLVIGVTYDWQAFEPIK
ncbi:MAG TPA: hypothetical protein VJ464_26290 [Blastocatellia bacterium]|nr:hypothetical protein [Blastocatellia bacterium]